MPDNTQPGGLPPSPITPSTPGSGGSSGGVNVPVTIHLPPATTEESRSFASVGTLSRAAAASDILTQQTTLISAAGKYIPLSYGHNRWAGYCYFFDTHPTTGAVLIGLLLCEGEIEAVLAVEINNQPLRAGASYTAYRGTASQPADPKIAALLVAKVPPKTYNDTLTGLAHVVVEIPAGVYAVNEIRGIDVEYLGKRVYVSRDPGQDPTDPSTWVYSTNPGDILSDFITSGRARDRNILPRYGRNCTIWDGTVTDVADFNDASIGNPPNLRPRSSVHVTMLDPTANETWEQALRTHAMCFVDRTGDRVELILDAPRSPVMAIDDNKILQYERVTERLVGAAPTMVDITYTDTSVKPWAQKSVRLYDPRVLTGEIPEITSQVDMKFSHSYAQAMVMGARRLNTHNLSVRTWGLTLPAFGLALQKGDTLEATHRLGMNGKVWAVDTSTDVGFGNVQVKLSEYDERIYSDVVQSNPSTLGNGAANCASVPAISGLAIALQSVYEPVSGGSPACTRRLKLTWLASTFPCLAYYEVELSNTGGVIDTPHVGTNSWLSAPVPNGTYTARVRNVSSLPGQAPGAWASVSLTVSGFAVCAPFPTTELRAYGTNQRRAYQDPGTFLWEWYNQWTRYIRCAAPATSITRTELWFGWGVNAVFGGAIKVRDDAGAQTQWVFHRSRTQISGFWRQYVTVALGTTPYVPTSGTFGSPGAGVPGSYTNVLSSYGGDVTEWWPPDKIWVRWNNGGVFSDPVPLNLSQSHLTYPDTLFSDQVGYMFDGTARVDAGIPLNATYSTDLASAYSTLNLVEGNTTYQLNGGHKMQGQLFDSWGDLISGYVSWQLWKI